MLAAFVMLAMLADAGPVSIDFTDEEEPLGGDQITTRNPTPVEFESMIPERYRLPPDQSQPAPAPGPRRRPGSCASCAAGGGDDAAGAAWLLLLLLLLGKIAGARRSPSSTKEIPCSHLARRSRSNRSSSPPR